MAHKTRKNSLRLQGFNYATGGAYFVTVCCKDRNPFLGRVVHGKMVLSSIGKILVDEWHKTDELWEQVGFDNWIVMPNHFHALIWFLDNGVAYTPDYKFLPYTPGYKNIPVAPSGNLSALMRGFKGAVTRTARNNGHHDFAWQRSFHDRIVRNEEELINIRHYILNNPQNWKGDEFYT